MDGIVTRKFRPSGSIDRGVGQVAVPSNTHTPILQNPPSSRAGGSRVEVGFQCLHGKNWCRPCERRRETQGILWRSKKPLQSQMTKLRAFGYHGTPHDRGRAQDLIEIYQQHQSTAAKPTANNT